MGDMDMVILEEVEGESDSPDWGDVKKKWPALAGILSRILKNQNEILAKLEKMENV